MDPITLSVISNRVLAIAEAMGEALVRSAFSPNIKERRDCSTAVFDPHGALVAQAEHIPLHLGSMLGVVEAVLNQYGHEGMRPGDAFVANDPYLGGGTHLPDVTVVSPFFYESELAGFAANVAHHADIGARVPGGISGDASSIDEEGLRLPPTRLAAAAGMCEEVVELFASHCRMPDQRRLDLKGQVAANRLGLADLSRLFDDYGSRTVQEAVHALLATTEQRARRAVDELPDGSYVAADSVEGVEDEGSITIAIQVDVMGDQVRLDFRGSGRPSKGAINVPRNALLATVYYALKACLDPGLPSNAGLHRSVEVSVPEVSIVNARSPSAVGARTDTCQCVAGCIIAALSQARPGRLPAPSNDASTAVVFSGVDPRNGAEYVYVEAVAGGAGASPEADGMHAVQVHITNTSNLPVEALEHAFPLLVQRYQLVPDSGGPGKFRGGLGVLRAVRVLQGEATFSAHGDRHEQPARGAAGGSGGGLGAYVITDPMGDRRRVPSKVSGLTLSPGSLVEIRTPGGGGYGRPGERDPRLLRRDVENGIVSADEAREAYGFDPDSQEDL
jgi:N-methylhydantoinase B